MAGEIINKASMESWPHLEIDVSVDPEIRDSGNMYLALWHARIERRCKAGSKPCGEVEVYRRVYQKRVSPLSFKPIMEMTEVVSKICGCDECWFMKRGNSVVSGG